MRERSVREAVAGSLGAAWNVRGGNGSGRRARVLGHAVAVVGKPVAATAAARVYENVDACLLTGSQGLADPAAAQAWAGLEVLLDGTGLRRAGLLGQTRGQLVHDRGTILHMNATGNLASRGMRLFSIAISATKANFTGSGSQTTWLLF